MPVAATPVVDLVHVIPASGLNKDHPVGGKPAASKPSKNGAEEGTGNVTVMVEASFALFPSATPFGSEVEATITLEPDTKVMAGSVTFMEVLLESEPFQIYG